MKGDKTERMIDEMKKLVCEFIQRESNYDSMITVTNASMSSDFKKAVFFVTVLPETKENAAIDFLKRNIREVKHLIKTKSRLSKIPQIDFQLDGGEKSRQKIDKIFEGLDMGSDEEKEEI